MALPDLGGSAVDAGLGPRGSEGSAGRIEEAVQAGEGGERVHQRRGGGGGAGELLRVA